VTAINDHRAMDAADEYRAIACRNGCLAHLLAVIRHSLVGAPQTLAASFMQSPMSWRVPEHRIA
jgi:hypothetical protein